MSAPTAARDESLEQAVRRLFASIISAGFRSVTVHEYASADGTAQFYRVRMQDAAGAKKVRPLHHGRNGWMSSEPPFPDGRKPIYNLPGLSAADPSVPVYIVEGELCADTLLRLGKVATTSGSCTSARGADWSVLGGRRLVIWADNDSDGRTYADEVDSIARAMGCNVRRIDIDALGLLVGGDVLDWLAANPDGDVDALPIVDDAKIGARLLRDVEVFVRRFCALPDEVDYVAVALWAAHTHMCEHFHVSPRLALLSPEPGSGKTRVLEVLNLVVRSPMFAFGASVAAIFRSMAAGPISLLIDECDTVFGSARKNDAHEDLRALINVGYKRGAKVPRCVGPNHHVKQFDVFDPVALAGLGHLPDTVLSRSLIIRMRRRAPKEIVEPFRERVHAQEGHVIRERLTGWSERVGAETGSAYPQLPEGVTDRTGELWEPLLAIADQAGGSWPTRAREACIVFANRNAQAMTLGVRLLGDIRTVFCDEEVLSTADLLKRLTGEAPYGVDAEKESLVLADAPWSNLKGNPLDARRLARMLAPYDIKSDRIRPGDGKQARGYRKHAFADAFSRYLSDPPSEDTSQASQPSQGADAIRDACDACDGAPDHGAWEETL